MTERGTLSYEDGRWVIECEPWVMMAAKRALPSISRAAYRTASVKDTQHVCRDLDWLISRHPLKMTERDEKYLKRRSEDHRRREEHLSWIVSDPEYSPPSIDGMAIPPRPYQVQAAEVAWTNGWGVLVGDDLGLGKTATSLTMLTKAGMLPACVVVQAHLQSQWIGEIKAFLPQLRVHRISKRAVYRLPGGDVSGLFEAPPDVLVITYAKLDSWAAEIAERCRTVIYDEVQEMRRGGSTGKYSAGRVLAASTLSRIGLSATPIYNYGVEWHNIFEVLQPGLLGSRSEFARTWCGTDMLHDKARISEPDAFGRWLRSQGLMVARTRADVGREIPPVQSVPHVIDSSMSVFDKASGGAEELAKIILRQTDASRVDRFSAAGVFDSRMRQATGLAKAPYVAAFVRMLVETGRRVLLAGWHHAVYEVWLSALEGIDVAMYTGRQSAAAKDAAKHRFVSGSARVMILSLRSGAGLEGLQDVCSVLVFGELDWAWGAMLQTVGRLHRDGSDGVTVYFPHSEHGTDPAMVEALGVKRGQLEGVMDPGRRDADAAAGPSGDHVAALAEQYLKSRGLR